MVKRIKDPETYYEEKADRLLGHLQKRTNKDNLYKVDDVEDKIFREEITTKSQIDKAMGYTKKKENIYTQNKNPSLNKYKTKSQAIHDLNVNKGGDYDEVTDYVNNNWENRK